MPPKKIKAAEIQAQRSARSRSREDKSLDVSVSSIYPNHSAAII